MFSKPQEEEAVLKGAPHSLQNFSPSEFCVLHFAQSIYPFSLALRLLKEGLGVVQDQPVEVRRRSRQVQRESGVNQ
jgi:hypothetical protein